MQKFQSTILFKCPECKENSNVDVDVPEFSWASFDRMSDVSSEGEVYIICPKCEDAFDGYAVCHSSGCEITLDQNEDMYVGDFPMYSPEPDEWSDYSAPEHPYDIFLQSFSDMKTLIDQKIQSDDEQILQRMIFTQIISAMEAYFCDTLINAVRTNTEFMMNLCNDYEPLKQKSYGLAQMASIKGEMNNFVFDQVKGALRSELYHKIDRISRLYQKGLDIKLIDDKGDREKLKIAIGHRHDCVHRNGFKKEESEKNQVFTTIYVRETMDLIKNIIDGLENKVIANTGSVPF